MNKIAAFFAVMVSTLVISCAGPQSNNTSNVSDVQITRKSIQSEVVKTVAHLSIDGMTCAAGCGGKIQQELRAVNGVKTTELDFEENRNSNIVSVEYDSNAINEQDLIKCVSGIADGMYVVKSVEILDYKGLQSRATSTDAGVRSNEFDKVFQLINLVQSISGFIR